MKPAEWITYVGGPLDGALERRARGRRLSSGRDDLGQSLTGHAISHQRGRIASGRDGTKHYLLAPLRNEAGDTAVYVHATCYRDVVGQ